MPLYGSMNPTFKGVFCCDQAREAVHKAAISTDALVAARVADRGFIRDVSLNFCEWGCTARIHRIV